MRKVTLGPNFAPKRPLVACSILDVVKFWGYACLNVRVLVITEVFADVDEFVSAVEAVLERFHRGELAKVASGDDLSSPEWPVLLETGNLHHGVDALELKVVDHADLVDYDGIDQTQVPSAIFCSLTQSLPLTLSKGFLLSSGFKPTKRQVVVPPTARAAFPVGAMA